MKFRIKKRARLTASLGASAAFIALAIVGWDLPVTTALAFLLICIGFLAGIVLVAAACGWLVRRVIVLRDDRGP